MKIGLLDKDKKEISVGDIVEYGQVRYLVKFGSFNTQRYECFKPTMCANRVHLELIREGKMENIKKDIFEDIFQENGFAFIYVRDADQDFETYLKNFGLKIVKKI